MRNALIVLLLSAALTACASAGDTGAPDMDAGGLADVGFDAEVIDAHDASSSPIDAASSDASDAALETSPDASDVSASDVSSPDVPPGDTGSDGGLASDASSPG